ncbi:MAG: hypothetical protein ACRDYW_13615 [Acidimicrobiales bacterium]
MSDQQTEPSKTPAETVIEQAVDTFVYAPIGLLFEGASLLPQLVEKGRSQVTMARMIGQFAVQQGRQEATKAAGKLQDQAAGVLDLLGGALTPGASNGEDAPAPPPAAKPVRTAKRAPGAAREAARAVAGAAERTAPQAPPTTPAAAIEEPVAVIDPGSLAIPDYDGLSASHVVNRLAGLAPAELEAVRRYEAANRGRKTILSKVAQLQSA